MNKTLVIPQKIGLYHSMSLTVTILVGVVLALLVCLQWLPSTYVNGEYIPMGPDSFYHARRIMDLVVNDEFYQFDNNIHAPEGSLLTWPWVYDYMLAQLIKGVVNIFHIKDPMLVLTYIPPLWVIVNVLLIIGVMTVLDFSPFMRLLGVVCFSLLPLTQELHAPGRIDHHYMELSVVLLSLFSGLYWLKDVGSKYRAILLGATIGLAPGINNGLFILQIPLLVFMFQLWISKVKLNEFSVGLMGISAIISLLVILLPSKPFMDGKFSYYYLSSFHLYVLCCSILVLGFFYKYEYSHKSMVMLVLMCAVLSIKLGAQIYMGGKFLTSGIIKYDEIRETNSIIKQFYEGGLHYIVSVYSGLLIVAPVTLTMFYLKKFHNKNPENMYLLIFCIFGMAMLLMQKRLHYFGSFSLIIPLLAIANERVRTVKAKHVVIAAILITICFLPSFGRLVSRVPVGNTFDYALTAPIFPIFKEICNQEPGVVLSDYDDGHYIRFHTNCSVIANNFVITPQHERKVAETDMLFSRSIKQLQENGYLIKYIYVRRQDNIMMPSDKEFEEKNKGLRKVLLGNKKDLPGDVKLVKELVYKLPDNKLVPFARLFKLLPKNHQLEPISN